MGEDLTKLSLPLIIIGVRFLMGILGVGKLTGLVSGARRESGMRVMIYKLAEGGMSILVQASPGKGRAPVVLQGVTPENVKDAVLPLIVAMRRPKGAQIEPLG